MYKSNDTELRVILPDIGIQMGDNYNDTLDSVYILSIFSILVSKKGSL